MSLAHPTIRAARLARRASVERRGFTLTELLVAIGVLVVVIVATARIFGTVAKVTGAGEANANLLQSAQAIERQFRDDIYRISRDGYLVIESIAVANNVNGAGAPLLNPQLPPNAILRADRLVFFVDGPTSSTQFAGSQQLEIAAGASGERKYSIPNPQAGATRVYWGHGVQVPAVKRDSTLAQADPFPELSNQRGLYPWTFDFNNDGPDLSMQKWDTGTFVKDVNGTQPSASSWILARQPILLADDGVNGFLFYNRVNPSSPDNPPSNNRKNSTRYLWADDPTGSGNTYDPGPMSSRVDISGHTLDKLRADVTNFGANGIGPTRSNMLRVLNNPASPFPMRFPRVENVAPSMNRADQMLTNPAIALGCSSFAVEWTWDDGTGRVIDPSTGQPVDPTPANPNSGDEWVGLHYVSNEQPWFGMPNVERNVLPLSSAFVYDGSCGQPGTDWGCIGAPIYPQVIEGTPVTQSYAGMPGVVVYRAVFGYNRDRAYVENPTTGVRVVSPDVGYTPWPTALRITMTLTDPLQRFAEGRTFQFVVDLPRR
ncbi:MAG: type II secretion system protein [Phycisphaerae bacterium]|nr:type II secretion system protein [Phycisphaerae bacterium]